MKLSLVVLITKAKVLVKMSAGGKAESQEYAEAKQCFEMGHSTLKKHY